MSESSLQVVETPGAYVYFVLSAFALTLVGGPLIGVMLWLARSGAGFAGRQPYFVQAHGWTQLTGWAGLFVAGFSLRLMPRFAGRPEASTRVALTVLGALVAGILLRDLGLLSATGSRWTGAAGELIGAAGMLGVAIGLVTVLRADRKPGSAWSLLAWFGAGWWVAWAVGSVVSAAAILGSGAVPYAVDRAIVWAVTLGAIGNFIWAVQSRMMPISFGRGAITRRAVLVPILAYNVGAALAVAAPLAAQVDGQAMWTGLRMVGFGIAGVSIVWLAGACGALSGKPERLRPASQPLGRFIIWANRWGATGGILLVLLSVRSLVPPAIARADLEDAALHAIGGGLITILIAGMLQLVAPVFAMERVGRPPRLTLETTVWALLMAAVLSRVVAALAQSAAPGWFAPLAGVSGLSGWLGLAALTGAMLRARGAGWRLPFSRSTK